MHAGRAAHHAVSDEAGMSPRYARQQAAKASPACGSLPLEGGTKASETIPVIIVVWTKNVRAKHFDCQAPARPGHPVQSLRMADALCEARPGSVGCCCASKKTAA